MYPASTPYIFTNKNEMLPWILQSFWERKQLRYLPLFSFQYVRKRLPYLLAPSTNDQINRIVCFPKHSQITGNDFLFLFLFLNRCEHSCPFRWSGWNAVRRPSRLKCWTIRLFSPFNLLLQSVKWLFGKGLVWSSKRPRMHDTTP
jgi:hypothetical protein